MSTYVFDAETFYDSKRGYTLKKMTTEQYINDPRFHLFGFSVSRDGGKPHWVPEEKVEFMLRQLKLHEHTVVSHNAKFDMAILNWKYGVRPKRVMDTLAMARGVFGNTESLSLSALAERLGVGVKGDAVLHMDGVRHPSTIMMGRLAEYCDNDVALAWGVYKKLDTLVPPIEQVVIDITTRMFTEPSFVIDKRMVQREIDLADQRREDLLRRAQCELPDLRSDAKFAAVLESLGITPPKKVSIKKSEKAGHPVYTWAFAKSDPDFKVLLEHEDDTVRWACEARLGLKSTIKESRSQRFMGVANRMGMMPIALDYYGANTGRYAASSSEKMNAQNLPAIRGSKDPDVGLLRKSLAAPDGKVVVVSDASQIEARIVAWLAGQEDLVSAFAEGRDVYSEMATKIYGRHVDRKANPDTDYIPGFLGKCTTLGCGYSMSFFKFGQTVYGGMLGGPQILFDVEMADQLGVNVPSFGALANKGDFAERLEETKPSAIDMEKWITHLACAKKIVSTYRLSNPRIPEFWKTCGGMIDDMFDGNEVEYGPVKTEKDKLRLPNGMYLLYRGLERDDNGDYSYLRRKEGRVQRVKLYGGALTENICQALAGVYVKEAMVRMYLKYGHRPILQVHDEVVVISDEANAQQTLNEVNECMTTVPAWAKGLPLASEGEFATAYGFAK